MAPVCVIHARHRQECGKNTSLEILPQPPKLPDVRQAPIRWGSSPHWDPETFIRLPGTNARNRYKMVRSGPRSSTLAFLPHRVGRDVRAGISDQESLPYAL